MTQSDEVRRMLLDAVPEVPTPDDRLSAVAARVRRRRARLATATVAAAALLVGIVVVVPQMLHTVPSVSGHVDPARPVDEVGPALPIGADGCLASPFDPPAFVDQPGPLLPNGAIVVIMCETSLQQNPTSTRQWVLTSDVDGFVRVLNSLPDRDRYWELLQQDRKARNLDPLPADAKKTFGTACPQPGRTIAFSFVVRYPDRAPVSIAIDENCRTLHANGRSRFVDERPVSFFEEPGILQEFRRRYRDQT